MSGKGPNIPFEDKKLEMIRLRELCIGKFESERNDSRLFTTNYLSKI